MRLIYKFFVILLFALAIGVALSYSPNNLFAKFIALVLVFVVCLSVKRTP